MRLLDLFCGAGGAAMGYHRAGFEVVGVDIAPQKHYPFEFHLGDALEFCAAHGREFDAIHASPPCQKYSITWYLNRRKDLPDSIAETRNALVKTGRPYVIENVARAPLVNPLVLCGTMFGLRVIRHRLFECSPTIWFPPRPCAHNGKVSGNRALKAGLRVTPRLADFDYLTVAGHDFIVSEANEAMDLGWMNQHEVAQAIPPAYTEFIASQLLAFIGKPAQSDRSVPRKLKSQTHLVQ